jgi:hypothetical protein
MLRYRVILCLWNDAFQQYGYEALNGGKICQVEKVWKEKIVAYFKTVSKKLYGGAEKIHEVSDLG